MHWREKEALHEGQNDACSQHEFYGSLLRDRLRKVLKEVGLVGANVNSRDYLVEQFEQVFVNKGSMIIRQGDPGEYFYYIQSGVVCVYCDDESAAVRGIVRGRFEEDCYFGDHAVKNNTVNSFSIIAEEDCVLWRIKSDNFQGDISISVDEDDEALRFAREDRSKLGVDFEYVRLKTEIDNIVDWASSSDGASLSSPIYAKPVSGFPPMPTFTKKSPTRRRKSTFSVSSNCSQDNSSSSQQVSPGALVDSDSNLPTPELSTSEEISSRTTNSNEKEAIVIESKTAITALEQYDSYPSDIEVDRKAIGTILDAVRLRRSPINKISPKSFDIHLIDVPRAKISPPNRRPRQKFFAGDPGEFEIESSDEESFYGPGSKVNTMPKLDLDAIKRPESEIEQDSNSTRSRNSQGFLSARKSTKGSIEEGMMTVGATSIRSQLLSLPPIHRPFNPAKLFGNVTPLVGSAREDIEPLLTFRTVTSADSDRIVYEGIDHARKGAFSPSPRLDDSTVSSSMVGSSMVGSARDYQHEGLLTNRSAASCVSDLGTASSQEAIYPVSASPTNVLENFDNLESAIETNNQLTIEQDFVLEEEGNEDVECIVLDIDIGGGEIVPLPVYRDSDPLQLAYQFVQEYGFSSGYLEPLSVYIFKTRAKLL